MHCDVIARGGFCQKKALRISRQDLLTGTTHHHWPFNITFPIFKTLLSDHWFSPVLVYYSIHHFRFTILELITTMLMVIYVMVIYVCSLILNKRRVWGIQRWVIKTEKVDDDEGMPAHFSSPKPGWLGREQKAGLSDGKSCRPLISIRSQLPPKTARFAYGGASNAWVAPFSFAVAMEMPLIMASPPWLLVEGKIIYWSHVWASNGM